MEMVKTDVKIGCEMGACKNRAQHTIKLSRVGIRSRIHVCGECLSELYNLIGRSLVPKSAETLVKKRGGSPRE